ncbi:AAA family ATPase [Streptomyces subrutilus]|uniref:ATP-binding protein n=1 Tax=Streptomyces subrutilus TaxID=36818 RepID=A0A5P2UK58_9ACTN|nr:AAA family ATPase [Streptomyces subrutilus]QEU78735.1 ATP/GTP-binding protein [Streptomyces subrutilus]WSJ32104.1 ATP-binding protein [Streptomyces subrutilus]GGZ58113.1 ATP-binding protein [Streptomyces subrutilus]
MKLAIAGTYSVGKTLTTMAVAHLTGLPRSSAKTMRELLPISIPGKTLEECTPAELIMLIMRRNQERAVNESHLPHGFVSDGSSLHEWAYGTVRVLVGINPNDSVNLDTVEVGEEVRFYGKVLEQMAVPAKQHAKAAYDSFVHLPIEFPLVQDGHRPVNERFRSLADELMLKTLDELNIPYHSVGGTIPERLQKIIDIYGIRPVVSIEEAIERAQQEYAQLDTTSEVDRVAA